MSENSFQRAPDGGVAEEQGYFYFREFGRQTDNLLTSTIMEN